ncbi:MAG: UdgX family uracil-DNA binding protein [Myxococcales bacterium]
MIAAHAHDFDSWREAARNLLRQGVAPPDVEWTNGQQGALFAQPLATEPASASQAPAPRVPKAFLEKAQLAVDHASPERFALLYRLLWKLTHEAAHLLDDPLDPDTARLRLMLREVREEEHRMHAFVRFRQTRAPDATEHLVAWYHPAHPVLRRVAPFFARRYPTLRWTLFTPESSAYWDGEQLSFGPGAPSESAPGQDEIDALFLSYYEHVFNPARSNVPVMSRHLTSRILAQLPEGAHVQRLTLEAPSRVAKMNDARSSASAAFLPSERGLPSLAAAAARCQACPIGEHATQTVFGEGPSNARVMFVGEQPGDEEDVLGRPFVGPAGRLLDELLQRAGLSRAEVYVTNAVKHFKFERTPKKKRLHMRPNRSEVEACRGWLLAEVEAINPEIILCLGATAAQSFCGPQFRIQRDRGKPTATPWAPWWMATYHPSALLRAPDEGTRKRMESELLADLSAVRERLGPVSG